jgi:hypothetical protein
MFKWLRRKPPVEPLIKIVDKPYLCSFKITVLPDTTIDFDLEWSDPNVEIGAAVGEILYKLTSGVFNKHIHDRLDNYAKEDEALEFVLAAKMYWAMLEEMNKVNEDEPLISPLQVFAMGDLPNT